MAGFVSSRIKHRGALLVSMFGIALTLVGAYFATSVWALRAVFFVMGICVGIHLPSSVATITAMVRKEDWGKALSIQQLGPPLSLVAAPLLAVLLLNWFSWNTTLLWIAGLCALLGLWLLLLPGRRGRVPRRPAQQGVRRAGAADPLVLADDLPVRPGHGRAGGRVHHAAALPDRQSAA